MKSLFRLIIFFGLIACAAYFTKPSETTIREKVRRHFLSSTDAGPKGSTREFITGGLAKIMAEKSIIIKDHVLYREVSYQITGEKTAIAVFGAVFFF